MSTTRRRSGDEQGAVVLLVGLLTIVMFTITALVVDLGMARVVRHEAQVASDSSALAAANALYLSGNSTPDLSAATQAAESYAADNYGVTAADWAGCTDAGHLPQVSADTSCISFDTSSDTVTDPPKVRVVAPLRNVKLPFGAVAGASNVNVGAFAQSALVPGGKSVCGLCVIGGGDHDMQNGDVEVSGGSVAFNGNVDVHNNGQVVSDGSIYVQGNATGPNNGGGYSPNPLTGQPAMPDPLATYQLPNDFSSLAVKSDPCTDGPGIYGAYNFPNATCTLAPGLYVITGEWSLTGSAGLDATAGVTLYFTCGDTSDPRACAAPGEAGGWLNAAGNGVVNVVAPSSGATQGLAIAYDRLNTSALVLDGNGASSYVGTIYAYSAAMDYTGNACSTTTDALIVVGGLTFDGNNGCLQTAYTQDKNVWVPPHDPHLTE